MSSNTLVNDSVGAWATDSNTSTIKASNASMVAKMTVSAGAFISDGGDQPESNKDFEQQQQSPAKDRLGSASGDGRAVRLFMVDKQRSLPLLRDQAQQHAPRCLKSTLDRSRVLDLGYDAMLEFMFFNVFDELQSVMLPNMGNAEKGGIGNGKKASLAEADSRHVWEEVPIIRDSMLAASSLMALEFVGWAGLFHIHFTLNKRLMPYPAVLHMKNVANYFLKNHPPADDDNERHIRMMVSSLQRFLYTHVDDPEGCLMGRIPSTSIASKCVAALELAETKPQQAFGWNEKGEVEEQPWKQILRGQIILVHVAAPGRRKCLRYVRFMSVVADQPGFIEIWANPLERSTTRIDISTGVFTVPPENASAFGKGDFQMQKLVHNPFDEVKQRSNEMLAEMCEPLFEDGGVNLYFVKLTEQDLIDGKLDLSKFDDPSGDTPSKRMESKEAEQAAQDNAKLLALFDNERKKIQAVRKTLVEPDLTEYAKKIKRVVSKVISSINRDDVYLPTYEKELAQAQKMPQQPFEVLKRYVDDQMKHLQNLIDFLIQNWAILSDADAKGDEKQRGLKTAMTSQEQKAGLRLFPKGKSGTDTPGKQKRLGHSRSKSSLGSSKISLFRKTKGETKK